MPRQRAVEPASPTMESVDLSGDPDPPEALRRWAAARVRRPLDPAVRPFDAALVKLLGPMLGAVPRISTTSPATAGRSP